MTQSAPLTVETWKTLTIRRRNRRTREQLRVRHRCPVLIEQLSESEFPLAARIVDEQPSVHHRVDYRRHRGHIFAPDSLGNNSKERPFPVALVSSAFAAKIDLATWYNPFLQGLSTVRGDPFHDIPELGELPPDVAELLNDGTDERDRDVARIASSFVMFDGLLWKQVADPVYTVDLSGNAGARVRTSYGYAPPHRAFDYLHFRLDRLDDAIEFAEAAVGSVANVHDAVVHLDRSLLTRDDRACAARSLGDKIVRETSKLWIKLFGPEAITEWSGLRDAVANEASDPDMIASAAGRILPILEALPLNELGAAAMNNTRQEIAPAVLRWTQFEGGTLQSAALTDDDLALLGEFAV